MTSPQTDRANGLVSTVAMKPPCDCATTANITLSGEQTIDGVTTSESRVLVKNQTTGSANGIYISNTSVWSRAADCDGANDIVKGTIVYISGGSTQQGTFWQQTTADPITIGSSTLTFSQTGFYTALVANSATAFAVGYYTATGTPVNYYQALNVGTGFYPVLQAIGSDTNISNEYCSKGTGGHVFNTNGPVTGSSVTQLLLSHTALSVNYLTITGAATGSSPTSKATGSDTNIAYNLSSKGTGAINFYSNNVAQQQFAISHTASAVNYLNATGAATGNGPQLLALGSDTNIDTVLCTKGTGTHRFLTNGASVDQFRIAHTASAVNYFQATGAATGNGPQIMASGNDTDINAIFCTKGTGYHRFLTNGATVDQFRVTHTASAVNFLQVTGSAAAAGTATMSAAGNDTDISIVLTPQGAGTIRSTSINAQTTASAANVNVDTSGNLKKSTSSLRYKRDVIDYDKGLTDALQMRPVYYKSKTEDDDRQYAGFISEEVNTLGLKEFVTYQDGEPDGLMYPNMVALLLNCIKQLHERVKVLEAK